MATDDRSQPWMEHRTVPWRDLRTEESRRPTNRDIRITDVKTMSLSGNFHWGIVKIETDADHDGIGEVYASRGTAGLDMARNMGRYLEGQNPLDVERLTDTVRRNYADFGGGLVGAAALTGIETALWDIKGKLLGVPVYELLGGKYRDEIKMYCDTHAGEALSEEAEADPAVVNTPEAYARAAADVVADGFDALKFDLDVLMADHPHTDATAGRMENDEIDHKVSLVEAVRDEIGYDIDLGMDLHWNYTVETAVRIGEKLDPYDLAWIEDPLPPEKTEGHRRMKTKVRTPLLTGENRAGVAAFHELANAGALDIAAPDVAKCGGLTELRRIATVCDLYGVPLAPHNIASPVGTIAGAHACASIPNMLSMEFHAREVPWWEDLVVQTDGSGPLLKEGFLQLPEGPGLGVEIDPDVAEAHLADGSELIV